ncbi:MAG: hypothetical protein ACXVCP_08935 [Bdellovibrio sp.]
MKSNITKSMVYALGAVLLTVQLAQADVAVWVQGSKKTVKSYSGITYHVIYTSKGQTVYLTKESAQEFADCNNGAYQIVRNSPVGPADYALLNMTCND